MDVLLKQSIFAKHVSQAEHFKPRRYLYYDEIKSFFTFLTQEGYLEKFAPAITFIDHPQQLSLVEIVRS